MGPRARAPFPSPPAPIARLGPLRRGRTEGDAPAGGVEGGFCGGPAAVVGEVSSRPPRPGPLSGGPPGRHSSGGGGRQGYGLDGGGCDRRAGRRFCLLGSTPGPRGGELVVDASGPLPASLPAPGPTGVKPGFRRPGTPWRGREVCYPLGRPGRPFPPSLPPFAPGCGG